MTSFLKALGLIALAELGDKSQLLALALAARYRPFVVLAGITTVAFSLNLVWALGGNLLGAALPDRPIKIAAGVLFIGFALWMFRDGGDGHGEETREHSGRHPFIVVTGTVFIAELGDKTMLATATLATTEGFLGTWLGAALGMTLADSIAIAAGYYARKRLPERPVRLAAAALVFAFGVWSIVSGTVS